LTPIDPRLLRAVGLQSDASSEEVVARLASLADAPPARSAEARELWLPFASVFPRSLLRGDQDRFEDAGAGNFVISVMVSDWEPGKAPEMWEGWSRVLDTEMTEVTHILSLLVMRVIAPRLAAAGYFRLD
jgi:hypothetical protein